MAIAADGYSLPALADSFNFIPSMHAMQAGIAGTLSYDTDAYRMIRMAIRVA
jgi:hypothetical protein